MSQKEYKKQYKEIEVIGRGNFGSATLVERVDTKKQYIAKKIVLSSLNPKQQDGALQEAQLLKDLNHKNIVSYVESFKEDDLLIIVMEYCEHGDLAFHIKRKKQKKEHFPEMLIVNWFYELSQSIKYIHEKKILHRDIKTSNIFITKDGTIKIGDFGISKVLENTTSVAKTVVGTPYYMSPEVCESKPYTYKSDIWALGCVLYELCALEHAFESNNLLGLIFKIVKQNISDIPDIYSKELNDLIHKLLNKNDLERPVIHDILNDMSTQKLFKQYLEVKVDPSQVKQESAMHQKKNSNSHQQSISSVNGADSKGNGTNKENNAINQAIQNNPNEKMSMTKTSFQDTSSAIDTVGSHIYQVNPQQIQSEHKEEPEYKIKHRVIKRHMHTPDVLNNNNNNSNNNNNNNSNNSNNNNQNNQYNNNNNDINDGTHDEYYYHDDDHSAFKPKRDRFDEGAAIKHNNFVQQESPAQLQKVKSQQTFNHQSKFKKDESSKHYDMYSSSGQAHPQPQSQPGSFHQSSSNRDKAYSQGQNNLINNYSNQKYPSHMYQQQQQQGHQEYFQQQNPHIMQKLTPKQLAQLKKDEKNRLQQEQLTEYTKSQAKNSLISRERYIQNVYGEKFLPNQSSLKQQEENAHKQQKNLHLEPINQQNKPLLKNNFLIDRTSSPANLHQQTNFISIDTQYIQDIPVPLRNGSQKSPTHLSQLVRQTDDKHNANVYSEMDYPIETNEKFAVSTHLNNRRKNNGSKHDMMGMLQEEDQQKQYYNQIHRQVPTFKSQFNNISGLPQKAQFKFHTQQDELAESEVIDQQQFLNKINNAKPKNPKIQSIRQEVISNSNQLGGVNYSNTQFESEILVEQRKNSGTLYQDVPLPNVKKIDSEILTPSPSQKSFESFFSKEDLNDQISENKPQTNSKGSTYKLKTKPSISNFKQSKQQKNEDDEYGQEQFEDYFSDEDAEIKKQNKLAQNNNSNSNDKNGRPQIRKQSNYNNNSNNNNNVHLEAIAENDCESTQFTPMQSLIRHQNSHSSQSGRKISSGRPSMNRVESNNQDSVMKISKKLSHQNSSYSTDDQSRLSNNQSRNSPKNANESSAFKNNANSQINANQDKLIGLRQKCKQILGEHFDKVYQIIQKSIEQNISNNNMKKQLSEVVGKSKVNDCFEVEMLIYREEEMKKK